MEHLGKLLKTTRKTNLLTQQELADRLGVVRQTIAKWEDGDISPSAIPAICDFISGSITQLDKQRRHFQAEHDVIEHKLERLKIQIRSIVDN